MERFRALAPASALASSSSRVSSRQSQVPSLIDERFDHDSCGVGFVASVEDKASNRILAQALTALGRLAPRGATAADGKSSDGVGVLAAIPRDFLIKSEGLSIPPGKPLGVGMVFIPTDETRAEALIERALL